MEAKGEGPRRKVRHSFDSGWDLASPISIKNTTFCLPIQEIRLCVPSL